MCIGMDNQCFFSKLSMFVFMYRSVTNEQWGVDGYINQHCNMACS